MEPDDELYHEEPRQGHYYSLGDLDDDDMIALHPNTRPRAQYYNNHEQADE